MDNLTNKNYKGNLVQLIYIDILYAIDLEEGVFLTLNIIKKTQNKTQENHWNCWIELYDTTEIVGSSYDQKWSLKSLNWVQRIDRKNHLVELSESHSANRLLPSSVSCKRSTINTTKFTKQFTQNRALKIVLTSSVNRLIEIVQHKQRPS